MIAEFLVFFFGRKDYIFLGFGFACLPLRNTIENNSQNCFSSTILNIRFQMNIIV